MMKRLMPLACLLLLSSCARTVSPEEFLSVYRRGDWMTPDAQLQARYTGRDGTYHYMQIRTPNPDAGTSDLLLYGPHKDETIRCPISELPGDFPTGFWKLRDEAHNSQESADETTDYVRRYLEGDRD